MSLQLSESLYPVDEVIGSFIQCILMNSSLEETLFWLWELLYTTPNICEGLVSIYQQFYSHTNSNVGRYITRKLQQHCETGENRHLADIVSNMRALNSSPTAYYIVKYSQMLDAPSIIYKRRAWMKQYPLTMTCLIGSLKAGDIKNIGVYSALSLRTNGFVQTKEVITLYAISIGKNDIDNGLCDTMCDAGIITIACLISRIINQIQPAKIKFTRSSISIVSNLEELFEKTSVNHYRKLTNRRLYSTHSSMPPLNYGRFTVCEQGFCDAVRHHWEYYCFNSIEWKKRFDKYEGSLDHNKKQILWSYIEKMENFYDDGNCMDFDEQPISTTHMSLHPIEVIDDPREWYEMTVLNRLSKLSI